MLPQAPQRYLMGVRLGTRLLSSCRAKNQKLASTGAAQQALDVLKSEESQAAVIINQLPGKHKLKLKKLSPYYTGTGYGRD